MKYIPSTNVYSLFKNNKIFSNSLPLAPYNITDLFLGSVLNLQSRQMVVSEVPDNIRTSRPQNCLIFTVESYADVLELISRVEHNKLTQMKLGTVDPSVVNVSVREGQRLLGIEFVGEADASLLNDNRLVLKPDCYAPNFSSRRLFTQGLLQQPMNKHVSLCVIKPHILKHCQLSKVLEELVNAGFDISSLELVNLNKLEVDEIFEVYKGVLNDYVTMREHLVSGPSILLTIEKNDNVVNELRELCGPHDPEIAKYLRPNTLRAKYGIDKVENAVHCTDLPDDGYFECSYFWSKGYN